MCVRVRVGGCVCVCVYVGGCRPMCVCTLYNEKDIQNICTCRGYHAGIDYWCV